MREILTIMACLMIALLTAALAGPYFVDWTAHRELVEAQLSKTLGARVATLGDIDLKLLPTPRLVLGGVEADDASGMTFKSQRVRLELAVAPLLRGDFRFIEAAFDQADISLDFGSLGARALPRPAMALPEEVQFERIALTNARLRVADGANAALDISGLDLEAEAASLNGPFKGVGALVQGGARVGFRFSTGARDGDRIRLKFISDEAGGLPRADLDGMLSFNGAAAARKIAFEGPAVFSGGALTGWRVSGPLKLGANGMSVDPLELKIGGDEVALGMSGAAEVRFGPAAKAQFTLAARQFDVDRLLSLQNANASELVASPARWIADSGFAARAPLPWRLVATTPAMTVGGETLTEVAADVQVAPGAPVNLRLEGLGPGRSKLLLDGSLETGAAANFQGRVEAGARDLGRLADWLAQASPDAAQRLRSIPFRSLETSGIMSVSAAGFSARELALKADRSSFRGAAALTRAIGAERARFFADLTSEALDLDGVPDLTGPGAALVDTDFSLGLDARAVRVARFGDGMIDAGRVRLKISRAGEATRLETLSLANIGGATFDASGNVGKDLARLEGRLDAQRLGDLAALLQRVAPGQWADLFAARATALSPARLAFNFEGLRAAETGNLRIDHLRVEGTARGTKIEATIRPDPGKPGLNGLLALDAPDAPQLVRQFGFEALPLVNAGRGRVSAEVRGNFDAGFDVTALAQIAGAQLSFTGEVGGAPQSPDVKGQARIRSPDAAPFLRLMTFGLPDIAAALPLEASARIDVGGGRATIGALNGAIAGAKLSGDLAVAADTNAGGRVRVTGELGLGRFSLPAMAALVLGPPQPARAGTAWSGARFASGLADAPLVDIDIKAGEFELLDKIAGRGAEFKLGLAPGLLQIRDLAARIGAADLSGRIALRRDGANASLSGALAVKQWRLEQAAFSADAESSVEFSTTGQTAAALVAGLAGAGRTILRRIVIPRADPRAPGRVIAQADEGQFLISENDFNGALQRELDKASLRLDERAFETSLAGGVLRLQETGGVSAAFDLRGLAVDLRASLMASPLPKDWEGAAPQVTIVLKGPFSNPAREVEAGTFVNAASARAIAREQARIEALEADIRERAYFVRYQKGLELMRVREREVAAWEAEQERLAAEAERRRLEEEKRVAEEARRRALEEERRRVAEAARVERDRLAEAARVDAERRAADARRREAEAAATRAANTPAPVRAPVFPNAGTDPSAAGRY